jgi:hypothetical protein
MRTNAGAVAAGLTAYRTRVAARTVKTTAMYGMILQRRVQANASGRPGPRAQTGDYRRSIHSRTRISAAGTTAVVETNAPQGWRLEKGFTGTDSLGRVYDQPPFEHFEPAFKQTEPEYLLALSAGMAP